MAYIFILHLSPTQKSHMAKILSRKSEIPVQQIRAGQHLEPNHAYVIRPNTTITIANGRLKVAPRNLPPGARHVSIDRFMISLAHECHERAIGVVLSGGGADGSVGIQTIKAAGGITFAQDDSAQFKDMPRNAIATGCVDFILSPEKIAGELSRIGKRSLRSVDRKP